MKHCESGKNTKKSALQAEGRGFDPLTTHQEYQAFTLTRKGFFRCGANVPHVLPHTRRKSLRLGLYRTGHDAHQNLGKSGRPGRKFFAGHGDHAHGQGQNRINDEQHLGLFRMVYNRS